MQGVQPQQDAIKFFKLLRNSLPVVRYMKNLHEYLENESTSTTVLTVMYLTYAFTSLLSTASSIQYTSGCENAYNGNDINCYYILIKFII